MSTLTRQSISRRNVALVLTWLVALVLLVWQAGRAHRSGIFGLDFTQLHDAAVNLFRHGDPYRLTRDQPFAYPPSSALLSGPLALVKAVWANDVGLIVTALSLVLLAAGSAAAVGRRAAGVTAAVTLLVLVAGGLGLGVLTLVNVSAGVAAAVAWVLVLARGGRWVGAAVVLGVAIALKPLVAPAVVLFLAYRKWRALAVAVAVAVGLNLITWPLLADPRHFVTVVVPRLLRGDTTPRQYNAAISAVVHEPAVADVLRLVVLVGGVALIAAAVVRATPSPVRNAILTVGPVLVIALAGGTDEGHYSLVAVPLLVAILLEGGFAAQCLAAVAVVILAYPGSGGPGHFGVGWVPGGQALALAASAVAVVQSAVRSRSSSRAVRGRPSLGC